MNIFPFLIPYVHMYGSSINCEYLVQCTLYILNVMKMINSDKNSIDNRIFTLVYKCLLSQVVYHSFFNMQRETLFIV